MTVYTRCISNVLIVVGICGTDAVGVVHIVVVASNAIVIHETIVRVAIIEVVRRQSKSPSI